MVLFLLYDASSTTDHEHRGSQIKVLSHVLEASLAILSKISFTNELRMAMALLEIPVSGCTCLSTTKSACQSECTNATLGSQTHPCRCTRSRFPFWSSSSSSCHHQRQGRQTSSRQASSWQQWTSRQLEATGWIRSTGSTRRTHWTSPGPCPQWKQAYRQ
jgi:hypothetical protein